MISLHTINNKTMKSKIYSILLVAFTLTLISNCTKTKILNLPIVTTTTISNVTTTTAASGGNVTSANGLAITARGVCWSTGATPTIADSKTVNDTGVGNFISNLTGLATGTTYHVRAYATNSDGTGYGDVASFTTIATDIDGNLYHPVIIGTQTWMIENLHTTRYNDGTAITTDLSNLSWKNTTSGAYAIYDDDTANNRIYGKLYNWYAVNTGKLAPPGWHIPTDAEWTTLVNYLGTEPGKKMKAVSVLWAASPGITNSNSSGLTVLPAGDRYTDGTFYNLEHYTKFWSSTEQSSTEGNYYTLYYTNSNATAISGGKAYGLSIRCIKD